MSRASGRLVVISGPSGVGKSSICDLLLVQDSSLRRVVTCTTRPPRPGERPGADYHFLTREQFEDKLKAGGFLEYAAVHGNFYGTPRDDVEDDLKRGDDLLLAIDVQGADQLRARFAESAADPEATLGPENLLTIFLVPPDDEALVQRLSGRGTEDAAQIAVRLAAARAEMCEKTKYDHTIVNDKLEDAVGAVLDILREPGGSDPKAPDPETPVPPQA